jgi:hypothetical protein
MGTGVQLRIEMGSLPVAMGTVVQLRIGPKIPSAGILYIVFENVYIFCPLLQIVFEALILTERKQVAMGTQVQLRTKSLSQRKQLQVGIQRSNSLCQLLWALRCSLELHKY